MRNEKEIHPLKILIIFLMGLLVVSYLSLLAGAYSTETENTIFVAFFSLPSIIQQNPFAILPFNTQALGCGICIYIVACLFAYASYEQNKRTMPGKEYGTAAFMKESEIKAWQKKYMDSQFYTEGIPTSAELKKMKEKKK